MNKFNCVFCGNEFERLSPKNHNQKFCSKICKGKSDYIKNKDNFKLWKIHNEDKIKNYHKTYYKTISKIKTPYIKKILIPISKSCEYCKSNFEDKTKDYRQIFCSKKCQKKHNYIKNEKYNIEKQNRHKQYAFYKNFFKEKPIFKTNCVVCSKEFIDTSKNHTTKYCSNVCLNKKRNLYIKNIYKINNIEKYNQIRLDYSIKNKEIINFKSGIYQQYNKLNKNINNANYRKGKEKDLYLKTKNWRKENLPYTLLQEKIMDKFKVWLPIVKVRQDYVGLKEKYLQNKK